jgi:hypothetical protein
MLPLILVWQKERRDAVVGRSPGASAAGTEPLRRQAVPADLPEGAEVPVL